jgi:hypothetical protein
MWRPLGQQSGTAIPASITSKASQWAEGARKARLSIAKGAGNSHFGGRYSDVIAEIPRSTKGFIGASPAGQSDRGLDRKGSTKMSC